MAKRSAWLRYEADIELGVTPVRVWGYSKTGRFVCRAEISAAGIAVYAGRKGGRKVADVGWENLVKRLQKK